MSVITTTDQEKAANDLAPEPAVVKSVEISASTSDVIEIAQLLDQNRIDVWIDDDNA